jgi:hypothetical protein
MFRRIKNDNEENGENYIVNWKIMQKRRTKSCLYCRAKGATFMFSFPFPLLIFFFAKVNERNKDQIQGKIMGVDLIFSIKYKQRLANQYVAGPLHHHLIVSSVLSTQNVVHLNHNRSDNTAKIYGRQQIYVYEAQFREREWNLLAKIFHSKLISIVVVSPKLSKTRMNLITMHLFRRNVRDTYRVFQRREWEEGWSLKMEWKEGKLLRASLELKFNLKIIKVGMRRRQRWKRQDENEKEWWKDANIKRVSSSIMM